MKSTIDAMAQTAAVDDLHAGEHAPGDGIAAVVQMSSTDDVAGNLGEARRWMRHLAEPRR